MKIGVLGGIGPEATSEYYNKLIHKLQQKNYIRRNTDYPQIIINSIPGPELIKEITKKELQPYIDGLLELRRMNSDFVAMICNTIHIYRELLQNITGLEIIDLRSAIGNTLRDRNITSTLILGTKATINNKLYNYEGVKSYKPNIKEQDILTKIIEKYNTGKTDNTDKQYVVRMCKKYLKKEAETVILGCTEIASLLDKEKIPAINTIDVLVEATIKRIQK